MTLNQRIEAQVLWGRTNESAGAPPYWPWLQAGGQYAAAHVDDLSTLIGPQMPPGSVGELSRIFPWLRQGPNFTEPEDVSDPEVTQFRLFDAYTSYLKAIANQAPLVVALDDLHWADKPTLLLLQHVARELSRTRILIVGNYRDTDITRQRRVAIGTGLNASWIEERKQALRMPASSPFVPTSRANAAIPRPRHASSVA